MIGRVCRRTPVAQMYPCRCAPKVSPPCIPGKTCAILNYRGGCMKEVRKVHYVKGVFVCPKCRQSYVQEKWIESWRVRCHRCDYRGALTDVSVEERMEEETFRR